MEKIKREYKIAFISVLIIGFITHFYMIINGFPNSDSMWNFYFDQNMITSGRWFLQYACGISSYYDLPVVISALALLYLAVSMVLFVYLFDLKKTAVIVLLSGVLVTFPALTATFSYLYTLDGYMLGVLLAVLSVCMEKKYRYGYLFGAVCVAFCMGIYQAYLPIVILLCMFLLLMDLLDGKAMQECLRRGLHFLIMGVLGGVLYYVILQISLKIQHVELSDYQGLSDMGTFSAQRILSGIGNAYYDFAAFGGRGQALFHNVFTGICFWSLLLLMAGSVIVYCIREKRYRQKVNILLAVCILVLVPLGTNVILLFSSGIYYHLVMRFQWVLFPMFMLAGVEHYAKKDNKSYQKLLWVMSIACALLIFDNGIRANIAYFNMNERYEKAYAYCLRLADRIERTEGYYTGMPIAMIGVIDEGQYPNTDITGEITAPITGTGGSNLLYTGEQYKNFMQHYLNITITLVSEEEILTIYESEEYRQMDPFPAQSSIRIVNGIMYIKTEPKE